MSKVRMLRSLVNQRLTAAAEEIFELFERTIAEYEEQLSRSKEENHRQQKLLDAVFNPEVQLHRPVQQLMERTEEVLPEMQERSTSPNQEMMKHRHVKNEPEELWSGQEGEQLQGPEEADISMFTLIPVPVKSEGDEEISQSSELNQSQTEVMETERDREDCGGADTGRQFDAERNLHPEIEVKTEDSSEPEMDDNADWKEATKYPSISNSVEDLKNKRAMTDEKSHTCSECGKMFKHKGHLTEHMRIHTGEKPFSCSVCGKRFTQQSNMTRHLIGHTREKLDTFPDSGEKGTQKQHLKKHTRAYKGEKPYSCPECGKTFNHDKSITRHMKIHLGEKPFSCFKCGKRFSLKYYLTEHMKTHTEAHPFSCAECGQRFKQNKNLTRHLLAHTRHKPFSCSYCVKRFTTKSYLTLHMAHHRGEKPFSCDACDEKFAWHSQLKIHKLFCGQGSEGSGLLQRQTEEKRETDTRADGEDCGGSEAARNSGSDRDLEPEIEVKTEDFSEPETEGTDDWNTRKY
ncbi:gastrula zinc finger protein XlCGF57.1-like [Cheilinus undulatus]|uniref:gastrula zinc finger protein XlCGF57.1-like n=1 Tax=Cheilinus undulatus TaxID=241271 RepID=UPI001BD67D3D|nr:gastrula zinc finger protein XlCGF57.1-like [Cheilinus undulatus]